MTNEACADHFAAARATQEANGEDARVRARAPPRVSAAQLKALKRFGAVQVCLHRKTSLPLPIFNISPCLCSEGQPLSAYVTAITSRHDFTPRPLYVVLLQLL